MGVGITSVAYSLPKAKLTYADLEKRFGADYMQKVIATTGILERRVASKDECASDFALSAAKQILESGVEPSSIDLLIMGTQMPDYQMPTTACILQNKLGISLETPCFDINLGCSQLVYGLGVANAWVKSGMAKRALVLSGDTPARAINPLDKSVVPLFADGGAAVLVENVAGGGFLGFDFGTDGRGWKDLIRLTSGMRTPPTPESAKEYTDAGGSTRSQNDMYMDGGKIFLFALKNVPVTVNRALQNAGLKISDIDLFVFHQASEIIVRSFSKIMGIPKEKLHYKMHDVGNIGGSTVAVVLVDAYKAGKIKKGDKILISAFGVGLSWGTAILEWDDKFLGAFTDADFSDSPAKPLSQQ